MNREMNGEDGEDNDDDDADLGDDHVLETAFASGILVDEQIDEVLLIDVHDFGHRSSW